MNLTTAEVEERLHDAIRTLAALPDRERKWVYGKLTSWPETMREAVDVMAQALERVRTGKSAYELVTPRLVPSAEQIDHMDEALGWMRWLNEREKKIITLRAFGMSFTRISWRYGKSDETLRRWHAEIVKKVQTKLRGSMGKSVIMGNMPSARPHDDQ